MMSYNSEIDSTMDNLSLTDPSSNDHNHHIQPTSPDKRNSLHSGRVPQYIHQPKKSLLSSSLAGERGFGSIAAGNPGLAAPGASAAPLEPSRGAYFSLDEEAGHNNYPNKSDNINIQRRFTDDHPEPELLASSVGKDMDGRLIPSSSTISLLSLNHQQELDSALSGYSQKNTQPLASPKMNPANFASHSHQYPQTAPQQPPLQPPLQPQVFADRKNSYSALPSRNSITHLNQIRLQPYQRFTSPPPGMLPAQLQPLSPQNNPDNYSSTSQSIPISNAHKNGMNVPDSPNLDPTSLGGSPSRFWLSSQTPPRSLANSKRNSKTYLYQMQFQQPQQYQEQPVPKHTNPKKTMYLPLHSTFNNDNYTTAMTTSVSSSVQQEHDSPNLVPVQTPSEDPPMTPLFLSKHTFSSNEGSDSYFGNYTATQQPNGYNTSGASLEGDMAREVASVATLIEENDEEIDETSTED